MEDRLDIYNTSEDELAGLAVYNVVDSAVSLNTPNRAEKSLPKNLILKPTNALPDSSTIGNFWKFLVRDVCIFSVWVREYIYINV